LRAYSSSRTERLTGIGNLDPNAAAVKVDSVQSQGLLQTLDIFKFGVGEPLGTCQLAVLDNPHIYHLAAVKKIGDRFLGRIVGEIAEVGGEGRLRRERLRKVFADRRIT